MTNTKNRDERLQIMLTAEELSALDDWRFAGRMPSRAAAVRELLRRGLAAEGVLLNDARMKSKDFGVTDGASRPHEPDADGPSGRNGSGHNGSGHNGSGHNGSGHNGSGDGAAS